MIVNKSLIISSLFQKNQKILHNIPKAKIFNRSRIGNRDWVGFGLSGNASYVDDPIYPFPAIRFKENTNDLLALREKEKGDWRKLTIEEKKTLYRASFGQTLEEVVAPTGEWKSTVGGTLICLSIALWFAAAMNYFILKERPETFSEEYRRKILRKKIDLKEGHLTGISSKWDYEKDDWKK